MEASIFFNIYNDMFQICITGNTIIELFESLQLQS